MPDVKKKTYATHITTPTGARVYVKANSKEELEEKVFQKKLEMRAGVDITSNYIFKDYCALWLRTYKKGKLRPSSYSSLCSTLDNHILPFFGDMPLRDIKSMHVHLFLNEIAQYSQSLQQKCLSNARSIFDSAVDNGIIAKSPVRKDDKITAAGPREEEPLTDDQAKALLAAVEGTRAYTFCLIALSTGMRRGEILGLMWEDIDWDEKLIHVTHNKSFPVDAEDAPVTELTKTEAGHRDLPISNQLYDHLLTAYNASQSDFVLCMKNGASLTKTSFRALWELVQARTAGRGRKKRELGDTFGNVNVSLDFDCHPHQLRHTFITKLFEEGLDIKAVQYLAGHSTPDMTMKVYTHYRNRMRSAITNSQVRQALSYLEIRQ
jgi:integrase